jgi:DNA-directed RNA polymerase subunit RPC12/RpoP
MADKEARWDARYGHLRANVPLRRTGYGWFMVLAILVFATSVVDIVYLDEVLFYGVLAAYGVLLLWGIGLLFSRRRKEGEEMMEFELADEMDLKEEYLRCPECRHVFEFDMEHRSGRKAVNMTCPECGYVGQLPPETRQRVAAAVPGGSAQGPTFVCDECGEHWRVGTLGHEPKKDVQFSACPHCGETERFSLLEDDDPATPY